MRKFLVRFFNLVYLAAAAISIHAFFTRPIIQTSIQVNFTQERIGYIVNKMLTRHESESEADTKIRQYTTAEKIETYFPDGYKLDVLFKIPASKALNLQNQKVVDEIVEENFYGVVDKFTESLMYPLRAIFKEVVEGFASNTIKTQIDAQLDIWLPDSPKTTDEEVKTVFENAYDLLDDNHPVTIESLAEIVLYGKEVSEGEFRGGVLDMFNARGCAYELWSPQPTEMEVTADLAAPEGEQKYFVVVIEDEKAKYVHNTSPYSSEISYFKQKPFTPEDIDSLHIAEQTTNAIRDIDGMVIKSPVLCNPQPDDSQIAEDMAKENESERIYYVLDENGNPVLPTTHNTSSIYYNVEYVVNDVETGLNAVVDKLLNGSQSTSRAIVRSEETIDYTKTAVYKTVQTYLRNFLSSNLSASLGPINTYIPLILLMVIILFALPWIWFAIITLIRTLRKKKMWTRPGIILFWALPQIILGIIVTYGGQYFLEYFVDKVSFLKEYAGSATIDIRTLCLIPSFVYFGVLAMTLVYWIIRRPLKRSRKIEKKFEKRNKYLGNEN